MLLLVLPVEAQNQTNRPVNWARPMTLPGVANFYQLDPNFYRGAQPTPEGMKQLKAMGIKTVINLRAFHSDPNRMGMKNVHFETKPWNLDEDDVVKFLKVAADSNNFPVFVHCERGADRTGVMCAMYRVALCGWTKPQAIDEMRQGGFSFSPVWQNLITFIEDADIARIKRRAGLSL